MDDGTEARRWRPAASGAGERLWWLAAAGCLVAFVMIGFVQRVDPRLVAGESVWTKPMKFAISTVVHFVTIALVVRRLRPAWSASGPMTALAGASIAAALFEIGYIALQGARAAPSHFNVGTPLSAALWSLMAGAAVVVLAPMAVVGALAAIDGRARWPAAVRLGVAVGLIGGAALTLLTAFRMGANMSRYVGAPPLVDSLVPLTGWSWHGADLRPAHFLATHMAQAVPLAALLASAVLTTQASLAMVALASAGWTALTLVVFANALAGRSLALLIPP